MAITTIYQAYLTVNGVDFSNHATNIKLNMGQATNDATADGDSKRKFRPGLGDISIEADLFNDHASGSIESTLRALISISGTGVPVVVQKINPANTATTPVNPKYTDALMVLDGDLNVLDEAIGDISKIPIRFVSYDGTLTVSTTAT